MDTLGGEELEEGEIAASGGSPIDTQPSNSSIPEQDELDDQMVQPQKKRKRSARYPRKISIDGLIEKITDDDSDRDSYAANPMQPASWPDFDGQRMVQRVDRRSYNALDRQVEWSDSWPMNSLHGPYFHAPYSDRPPHENHANWHPLFGLPHSKLKGYHDQSNNVTDSSYRDNRTVKLPHTAGFGSFGGARMPESVQKKCKSVLSKLRGAVNRDGHQVAAKLMELPRHSELPEYYRIIEKPIDARRIEEHLDHFEYATAVEFAADVQLMLTNAARYDSALQADARRLQALFFERMALLIPDVDFNSVRINIGVSVQHTRCARSQRKIEPGLKLSRLSLHTSEKRMPLDGGDDSGQKVKAQKHSKATKSKSAEKAVGKEPEGTKESSSVVLHPVDLIIHRKKRNSRQRTEIRVLSEHTKKRTHSGIPKLKHSNEHNVSVSLSKQQVSKPVLGPTGRSEISGFKVVGDGILNPRKKMRTDVGKRRPAFN